MLSPVDRETLTYPAEPDLNAVDPPSHPPSAMPLRRPLESAQSSEATLVRGV